MQRFEKLEKALDAMVEPLLVTGEARGSGPITLVLPGGPSISLGDLAAGEALLAHAEIAPFGDGRMTRTDPKIRRAFRLTARGGVQITGFDPEPLLDEIERAISPRERLRATLLDVHIYPPGGHFTAHLDTPREAEMIGTLVVALPSAHTGGALIVRDGDMLERQAWGGAGAADALPWVAFYGDVEHAVEPVDHGARITLSYVLSERGEPRTPPTDRTFEVRAALREVLDDLVTSETRSIIMPCARRAIVPRDGAGGLIEPERLRGADRDVAELLRELGLVFIVRPCLAFLDQEHAKQPAVAWAAPAVTALDRALTPTEVSLLGDLLTLSKRARDDDGKLATGTLAQRGKRDGTNVDCTTLVDRIADLPRAAWLWRTRARATLLHETDFSADGTFGNEHFDALVYEFVALEVQLGDRAAAMAPAPAARRVRHAKFGDGEVLSETGDQSEVRFGDGTVRKLLTRVLTAI